MHKKHVWIAVYKFFTRQFFFIVIIEFLAPKNICINTNFVTLAALELKLLHKTWFPDFDGGHFENSPKQVVHPNFFLWHRLLISGEVQGAKKTWSQTVLGGCTVTLSGPWTNITWWCIATFTSILYIYKAFKNIWMIVLNILGYFGRNKQNSYAALNKHCVNVCCLVKYVVWWRYLSTTQQAQHIELMLM